MRCGWSGRTALLCARRSNRPVTFQQHEEERHEKVRDHCRGEHATDDAGADGVQAIRAGTGGDRKRYRA